MLEHLPQDLPEAFDRALGRVHDTRYDKHIFQVIAAAKRPLTLEELRIALNVRCGETEWNPLTLPKDARSIIALCGGSLLEVDEETEQVHFIHHSVSQHLQSQPRVEAGHNYHFGEDEADGYLGAVCVTYLSYGIFDTQICPATSLVVQGEALTRGVSATVEPQRDLTTRLISLVKAKRRAKGLEVDIGRMVQQHLQPRLVAADAHLFLDYAKDYWLAHSPGLSKHCSLTTFTLYAKLLANPPNHVGAISTESKAALWALDWESQPGKAELLNLPLPANMLDKIAPKVQHLQASLESGNFSRSAYKNYPRAFFTGALAHALQRLNPGYHLVDCLLRLGADLNFTGADGKSMLEMALEMRKPGIAKRLLRNGALPQALNLVLVRRLRASHSDGKANRRNSRVVMNALKCGADPNFVGQDGRDVLRVAIISGTKASINLLVRGADVNFTGRWDLSTLGLAFQRDDSQIIQSIVQFSKSQFFVSNAPIMMQGGQEALPLCHWACVKGWAGVVRALIHRNHRLDRAYTVTSAYFEGFQRQGTLDPDWNLGFYYNYRPLYFAIVHMHRRTAMELLEASVDPNMPVCTICDDSGVITTTISSLTAATLCADITMVRILLRYGANPQLRHRDGQTSQDVITPLLNRSHMSNEDKDCLSILLGLPRRFLQPKTVRRSRSS